MGTKQWNRAQVRDALGDPVAKKASHEFCAAYADRLTDEVAHAAVEEERRLSSVVLELVPEEPRVAWESKAMVQARTSAGWGEALASLRAALRVNGSGLTRAEALLTPKALLRQAFVREMQERCYRTAAPVRDLLDRAVIRLNGSAGNVARKASVQYCWLNQTFYAWIDDEALREIAANPLIRRVDVSRTLRLQIRETAKTVGAVQHRETSKHSGKGVVVAVIDSEVALLEPVFGDRLVHKRDFTGEGWGHPDEHGTAVAAIIAANGAEVQGIAPDAVIFNYKVQATGIQAGQDDFFGACAIAQALEDGADIANCSWGTEPATDGSSRESRACDMAWAAGMTVVHAVGNDGPPLRPADAKGVIVVGATGRDGRAVQEYSAFGKLKNGKRCPDMVAPGGHPQEPIQSFREEGSFGNCGQGTSFAAPHVSGMLALLLEADPGLTPDEQRKQLEKLCKPLKFGEAETYGRGLPSFAHPS